MKKSKVQDGLTDLTIHCRDGSINAHQMILAPHSKFLKRLFLEYHSFEFAIIDWEKSIAQLTGRRTSHQVIEIYLPDFTKEDVKRLLSLCYTGQILIDNEVQSLALKNLWKSLGIDSIKLSDLDFSEVDGKPNKKPKSEIDVKPKSKNEERAPKFNTPQKKISNSASTASKSTNSNAAITKKALKTPQKVAKTPQKSKSPNPKPRGRPPNKAEDIILLDEDEPPAKKRPPSPLPKAVSLKSPQKNVQFNTIKCERCQQNVNLHSRDIKGNTVKYQMHVVTCYKDYIFYDVPQLDIYYCPRTGSECNGEFKNRMSFLYHLGLNHLEFYPRILRLIRGGKKVANPPNFEQIIKNIQEYPTLNFDEKFPDLNHVTSEISIYEAFEAKTGKNLTKIEFQADRTSGSILSKCSKCRLDLWSFLDMKRHVSKEHKMPVKFSCQNCGKCDITKELPTENNLKSHRCDHEKSPHLESTQAVFLPMEETNGASEIPEENSNIEPTEFIELD